jgi:hypothetical protein
MVSVQRFPLLVRRERGGVTTRERRVEDRSDAADRERKDQAFDIETRAGGQIEQARRVPVLGNEQGLAQTEGRGEDTGPTHRAALCGKGQIEHDPRYQEGLSRR